MYAGEESCKTAQARGGSTVAVGSAVDVGTLVDRRWSRLLGGGVGDCTVSTSGARRALNVPTGVEVLSLGGRKEANL